MTTVLACTWHPLGEGPHLQRLLPTLLSEYAHIVIAVRPGGLEHIDLDFGPNVTLFEMAKRGHGRYLALERSLEFAASHVHYADLDVILFWVDHHPEEWLRTLTTIRTTDALVIGRTERAFETCPQAIQQTERLINTVFSEKLGREMDFGLGTRGYSGKAVEVILESSKAGHWGDAEWPLLVYRAGLKVAFVRVDGVPWLPSNLCYADTTEDERTQLARVYDEDVRHWRRRVQVAQAIIGEGLGVSRIFT